MRVNHRRKSTVSIKMFISEFGENFSDKVKQRLMELESRCFLTRKEIDYRFDLKHVEHIQYECVCDLDGQSFACKKEYAYAQFVVYDRKLYFSESCLENKEIMQSPMVSTIYSNLQDKNISVVDGINLKMIDDSNIDFVIDSILSSCPEVSKAYTDIIQGMVSRSEVK